MIRRAGGVFGGKAEFQFEKLIRFECDHVGCAAVTVAPIAVVGGYPFDPEQVADAQAERLARAEGWLVLIDRSYCPKHKQEHAPDIEIGSQDVIFSEPPPPTSRPPRTPPPTISDSGVMGFMALVIAILCLTLFIGWLRLRSAEMRNAWTARDRFEQKAHVTQISCPDIYAPLHCSGRMSTEGKPDVPVRYVCTEDDCWFEK